jgi:hypothetical protein
MIRAAPEDLDCQHGFLDLVVSAFEIPLDDKTQESGQALVTCKTGARQNSFEFLPRGLMFGIRDGHSFEHIVCFQNGASVENAFNPIPTPTDLFDGAGSAQCVYMSGGIIRQIIVFSAAVGCTVAQSAGTFVPDGVMPAARSQHAATPAR